MYSIYFNGDCFREFESALYFISATKSEFACARDFTNKTLEYLVIEDVIYEEYKNRNFFKSTDDDISFMKSIISNMERAVRFDFEKVVEFYTMKPEDSFEHMMIFVTENNYLMLYWNTTA